METWTWFWVCGRIRRVSASAEVYFRRFHTLFLELRVVSAKDDVVQYLPTGKL